MTLKEWVDFNERLLCGDWIHLHVTDDSGDLTLIAGAFRVPIALSMFGGFTVIAITGELVMNQHLVSLALVSPSKEDGDPGDG